MTFTSKSNHSLSKLWLLLNELNHKVKATPNFLSPYPQDSKSNLYDSILLVYNKCQELGFNHPQVAFLESLIAKLKPIADQSPNLYARPGRWWGFETYEEYAPLREQWRTILLSAHAKAPDLSSLEIH